MILVSKVSPYTPVAIYPHRMFSATFGIGTYLTNDFRTLSSGGKDKSKALNMVIKITSVDGEHCVKISDDLMKVCVCVCGCINFVPPPTHIYFGSEHRRSC